MREFLASECQVSIRVRTSVKHPHDCGFDAHRTRVIIQQLRRDAGALVDIRVLIRWAGFEGAHYEEGLHFGDVRDWDLPTREKSIRARVSNADMVMTAHRNLQVRVGWEGWGKCYYPPSELLALLHATPAPISFQ